MTLDGHERWWHWGQSCTAARKLFSSATKAHARMAPMFPRIATDGASEQCTHLDVTTGRGCTAFPQPSLCQANAHAHTVSSIRQAVRSARGWQGL